jgi:AraC-like DNA-binding protein
MTTRVALLEDEPSAEVNEPASRVVSPQAGGVIDFAYRSSKLDEFEYTIRNAIASPHSLVPVAGGMRIDGDFRFHGANDIAVFNIRYGRELAVQFHEQLDDRLAFAVAPQGTGRLDLGRKELLISRQQGAVFSSGRVKILHYDEACDTQVLALDRRKIAAYCAKLLGREAVGEVEFDSHFNLDSLNGRSWMRLLNYVAAELSAPHSLIRDIPAARQQLEQMAITGFLLAHTHNYSDALLRPQSAAAPFYVRRAEAYIEAHFSDPLSLADIAAHAAVSARSLQNGFQSFRGMTPMAFLRSVRLQRAQMALLRADPAYATVTEIALSCGFTHLGEFGALYRRAFGETPKQTLSKVIYR